MPVRSLLFAVCLLALGACASPEAEGPRTFTDDDGRSVSLAGAPETVVPLAPNLTEMIAVAAGVDRLAGVATADDWPAEVRGVPRFASLPLDRERILELGPGLALGVVGLNPPADLDALAGLGIPAYAFRFAEVDDIPRALRTLDTLLASSGGAAAADAFEARVGAVRAKTAAMPRPRVLLLIGAENSALYAFGRESYASEVVRLAGADNVTDAFSGDAAAPSVEWVLENAPEVILIAGEGDARQRLIEAAPALAGLSAVQNGRVYSIPADPILRPGPRTVEALETIARRLHPEAFASGAA
ncbi:ABC transporter substrate-binding protein [Rubricoccus marinus]|uniref:Fe/B12 periplasmic-binding domain-containing protein n=1 Tax=Rubricoccus marinus TaxID=716817 RepID=A0A259TX47_9BACT|nr:ABC transporter substrate-binding protein [Rubricoccus marinus]OZC02197.1 hypothetical protein BSZ36_03860 [Rubricoccus marinus]